MEKTALNETLFLDAKHLFEITVTVPGGLVVRIWRSHRHSRGSIPRLGVHLLCFVKSVFNIAL